MKKNVGDFDRIIRVAIGLALLSLLVFVDGNSKYFGLIGIIPLATGLFGYCGLYTLLGINTCKRK